MEGTTSLDTWPIRGHHDSYFEHTPSKIFKALGCKEDQPVTASRARSSFASFAWLALCSSMTCKELVSTVAVEKT